MIIGVIFVGFNTSEYLDRSLLPWVNARQTHLDNHEFLISAVSVPFLGFEIDKVDDTTKRLKDFYSSGQIDHIICDRNPMHETDARGLALNWLVNKGVDALILVDSDEIWTPIQIVETFRFVQSNPFMTWFKVCYKNRVFSENQYLAEPFCPPRIFRCQKPRAIGFWDDNNVEYLDNGKKQLDRAYPNLTIPQNLVWVDHFTWLNNYRSKVKISYQRSRNWVCSFAWDNPQGGLIWNKDYFLARGESIPLVITEND